MFLGRSVRMKVLAMSHLAWLPAALAQPVPLGPEFQVNTYTTTSYLSGSAVAAAAAADGTGKFLIVWGNANRVDGQRFDGDGTSQGGEFLVSPFGTAYPDVATNSAGDYVVVWTALDGCFPFPPYYFTSTVYGQRYDNTGTPQGGAVEVSTADGGIDYEPAVTVDGAGNFVVVWTSEYDEYGWGVRGRRFDSSGTPQGGEFQVNSYTTSDQVNPAVAADSAGNFVVTWQSSGSAGTDTSLNSIQGQRYDSTGAAQRGEFHVNSYTTGAQVTPAVAADSSGNFVVTWQSSASAGTDTWFNSIQGRRYDSTGAAQGGEFQVNTYTTEFQTSPAVAVDGAGNFVVVWESSGSAGTDTYDTSIQGQRYDGTGTPQGGEFQVNTYTTDSQTSPAVAVDGAGNFVVVWRSNIPLTSDSDVKGQRFAIPTTSTSSTSSSSSTSSTTLPPTDLLPGRSIIIRPRTLVKFVANPDTGDTFALPSVDPMSAGGSLRIFDSGTTAGDNTYSLPSGAGWKGLGNPPGAKGHKYKGAGTPTDPCKVVLVKEKVIKGMCRGSGVMLTPPFAGDVAIVLSVGTTDGYCASFGGADVTNDATLTKRNNAPAPGTCPASIATTTTTSSTTTSTVSGWYGFASPDCCDDRYTELTAACALQFDLVSVPSGDTFDALCTSLGKTCVSVCDWLGNVQPCGFDPGYRDGSRVALCQ